jgi:hypothetical protein
MTVMAPCAEAKVIYTKTDRVIIQIPGYHSYSLDVNNDGVADFFISYGSGHSSNRIEAGALGQGAGLVGYIKNVRGTSRGFDSALPAGEEVGPKRKFIGGTSMAEFFFYATWTNPRPFAGPWAGKNGQGLKKPHYLGLKFTIQGKVHYGWSRLTFDRSKFTTTLKGYAYETVPNKAIVTGNIKGPDVVTVQPGSLGQLARGRK